MYFVYVLWSFKLRKRYVGSTGNVEKRLEKHNRGCNKFTTGGIPWILIHQEKHETKSESAKRERFLKSGQSRKWLDNKFPNFRKGAGVV